MKYLHFSNEEMVEMINIAVTSFRLADLVIISVEDGRGQTENTNLG